ncbi:penicillin-binding protein 1C [Marinomonas sp. CT5]|uniref:penicillin-binding protein 1C n=1 Tax=Marinomonas sp. CT5 TaxID=2066133 RepID=UPI001BB014AE|nr:penicillin-binding protein 1C [Marinomonas sp. CT5]QUX93925.1 penicillin-binding protein 1C [Marinomonas sp. CT5]
MTRRLVRCRLWASLPIIGILLFFSFLLYDWAVPVDLTSRSLSQTVLAEDGSILRNFADENGIWRFPVTLDDVSPNYLDALITYEDQYFYQHPGVNVFALLRATWQWISTGQVVSGGSTLTMQVARIRYPEPRTVWGKLKEIVRALQLEWHFSKADILTYYLNHAPFGGTYEGIQAASLGYFGHTVKQLTDAQAALLAVLPQAPSYYRPDRHRERAQQARDKLMRRLVTHQHWSDERLNDALIEDIPLTTKSDFQSAPLLARRLVTLNQAPRIKTFIHSQWQSQVSDLLKNYVHGIGQKVSAAALVVENKTGKVKVYAGSADFNDNSRFAYVDMVQAIRSPGSTLKPFIYGMALDEGLIHSESLLMDVPLTFGDYQPDNFNGSVSGPVSVTYALQKSLNIPAVQVLEQLKPIYFFLKMKKAGIELKLPTGAKPNLAVALGGVGSSLEDLVYAYTSLGNKGQAQPLRFSTEDKQSQQPLLSDGAAWIIRKILLDNPDSVSGLAVKTGTSYGFRDAWAIGVSQHYTLGVWIGRPDGIPIPGHYGQVTAVPLLNNIYQRLNDQRPEPLMPDSVSNMEICWPQGDRVKTNCEESRNAYIVDGTVPKTWYNTAARQTAFNPSEFQFWQANDSKLRVNIACQVEAKRRQVIVWPAPLEHWLSTEQRRAYRIPNWDPRCKTTGNIVRQSTVRIHGLANQDAFQLPKQQNRDITISAEGGEAPFYWFLNSVLLSDQQKKITLKNLKSGHYQLTLIDQAGSSDQVEFSVRLY